MRSVFESWFVHYKVDAVFSGHVHAYERSVCFSSLSLLLPPFTAQVPILCFGFSIGTPT